VSFFKVPVHYQEATHACSVIYLYGENCLQLESAELVRRKGSLITNPVLADRAQRESQTVYLTRTSKILSSNFKRKKKCPQILEPQFWSLGGKMEAAELGSGDKMEKFHRCKLLES